MLREQMRKEQEMGGVPPKSSTPQAVKLATLGRGSSSVHLSQGKGGKPPGDTRISGESQDSLSRRTSAGDVKPYVYGNGNSKDSHFVPGLGVTRDETPESGGGGGDGFSRERLSHSKDPGVGGKTTQGQLTQLIDLLKSQQGGISIGQIAKSLNISVDHQTTKLLDNLKQQLIEAAAVSKQAKEKTESIPSAVFTSPVDTIAKRETGYSIDNQPSSTYTHPGVTESSGYAGGVSVTSSAFTNPLPQTSVVAQPTYDKHAGVKAALAQLLAQQGIPVTMGGTQVRPVMTNNNIDSVSNVPGPVSVIGSSQVYDPQNYQNYEPPISSVGNSSVPPPVSVGTSSIPTPVASIGSTSIPAPITSIGNSSVTQTTSSVRHQSQFNLGSDDSRDNYTDNSNTNIPITQPVQPYFEPRGRGRGVPPGPPPGPPPGFPRQQSAGYNRGYASGQDQRGRDSYGSNSGMSGWH